MITVYIGDVTNYVQQCAIAEDPDLYAAVLLSKSQEIAAIFPMAADLVAK